MENVKRDYHYVEEHLSEYGEEYTEIKDQIRELQKQNPDMFEEYTDAMIQSMIYHGLHVLLIEKGKELVPEHCSVCPFYDIDYENGRMFYSCGRNTKMFTPEFAIWGAKNDRPEWCCFNNAGDKT